MLYSDIILVVFFSFIHFLIKELCGQYFSFDRDSLGDILNELISSSISAGGFVLAAMAIIASIKQNIPYIDSENQVDQHKYDMKAVGRSRFYHNEHGYPLVVRSYSFSCITFLLLFIFFSILRGLANNIDAMILFYCLLSGGILIVSSLFRCIRLLWRLVNL